MGSRAGTPVGIGIEGGWIVAIEPGLRVDSDALDLEGRLVSPGFIETHIHLGKSCIPDRREAERGGRAFNANVRSQVRAANLHAIPRSLAIERRETEIHVAPRDDFYGYIW